MQQQAMKEQLHAYERVRQQREEETPSQKDDSGHTEPMTHNDTSRWTRPISPNEPDNDEVTFQPGFEEAAEAHLEEAHAHEDAHPKEAQAPRKKHRPGTHKRKKHRLRTNRKRRHIRHIRHKRRSQRCWAFFTMKKITLTTTTPRMTSPTTTTSTPTWTSILMMCKGRGFPVQGTGPWVCHV